MKKGPNIELSAIGPLFSKLLIRFHVVIFVLIVVGGLAVVIFLLNQTIIRATDISSADQTMSSGFDRTTIEALGELSDDASEASLDVPSGRINPFTE